MLCVYIMQSKQWGGEGEGKVERGKRGEEEKERSNGGGGGVGISNVLYIQTNFGSSAVGLSAIPSAFPSAVCNRKIDMTKHFILGGAFVKAYSNPVTTAKISLIAIKKYAGD